MTYDDTVIAEEIVEEIEEVFENLEEVFEYIEFSQVEELFEEFITFFEEPEMEEELSFEPMLTMVEEMVMEEEMIEEEIIEEFAMEEESMIEEEMLEEEAVEEEFTEEEVIEEKPTKMAEEPNEKKEESNSETTETAEVKNENNTKQKNIQSKETTKTNLVKIMDKVDKDIKDISKNLQIKNIIKLDAMASEQASLDSYDIPFYKSKDIYMDQLQIQDMRELYTDVSLNNYIANDPVVIMENKLRDIETKKQLLIIELEALKNG